jgi:hypothetical protein
VKETACRPSGARLPRVSMESTVAYEVDQASHSGAQMICPTASRSILACVGKDRRNESTVAWGIVFQSAMILDCHVRSL